MKNEYWIYLESKLVSTGFVLDETYGRQPVTRWYVRANLETGVTTSLRFVFKPKMHVLTVHLGWNHPSARDFCLTALQLDWSKGFEWLSDAGVIGAPCLSLFNLADHFGWKLGGMPIGGSYLGYESIVNSLEDVLTKSGWTNLDRERVLERFLMDEAPFNWQSSNSAIRLGQIAGLCKLLGVDVVVFERCASDHEALIQADMFELGRAADWISSLRARIVADL